MYDMYRPGYSYESKRCHVKSDLKIHLSFWECPTHQPSASHIAPIVGDRHVAGSTHHILCAAVRRPILTR